MAQPPNPSPPRFPTVPNPPLWDPDNNPWTPTAKVIGDFVEDGGGFEGAVKTLALRAPISMRSVAKKSDVAPDYRVTSEGIDLGRAWTRTSEKQPYLEVEIDDPSFHAPIRALLLRGTEDGRHYLIWGRP